MNEICSHCEDRGGDMCPLLPPSERLGNALGKTLLLLTSGRHGASAPILRRVYEAEAEQRLQIAACIEDHTVPAAPDPLVT